MASAGMSHDHAALAPCFHRPQGDKHNGKAQELYRQAFHFVLLLTRLVVEGFVLCLYTQDSTVRRLKKSVLFSGGER
jgi:hypothetical protein